MTEDSNQIPTLTHLQRGFALAEANMASNSGADNGHIPETGPSSGHVPSKLAGDSYTIQAFMAMPQVDVSDGNWRLLNIWRQPLTNKEGIITTIDCSTLGQIGMDTCNGIYNPEFVPPEASVNNTAKWTVDNTLCKNYMWGRLNSLEVQLKNFSVAIERDTSGGIQFKDEVVFEVQLVPMQDIFTTQLWNRGTMYPANTYTTTLKEGIHLQNDVKCGLFPRLQMYGYVNSDTPGTVYTHWLSFMEYSQGGELGTDPLFTWNPHFLWNPHNQNPFYEIYVRAVNIPLGLSNIKIYLSYSCELKAHWNFGARIINPSNDYLNVAWKYEGQQATFNSDRMKRYKRRDGNEESLNKRSRLERLLQNPTVSN